MAAPQYVASANNVTNADATTVDVPTGTMEGDLIIAVSGESGATAAASPDGTGWTSLGDEACYPNTYHEVFWKFATAAEPASYTFAVAGATRVAATLVTYRYVHGSTPINAVASSVNTSDTSDIVAPPIDTTVDDTLVVVVGANNSNSSGLITFPAGWTERIETGGKRHAVGDKPFAATGATGTTTLALSSSTSTSAWTIALAPSGDAPEPDYDVGTWRWYTDAATDGDMTPLAPENTAPTLTGAQMQNGTIRLRAQLLEHDGTGSASTYSLDFSGDGGNTWLEAQTIPSNPGQREGRWFKWVDGAATAGDPVDVLLLSGSTEVGVYLEAPMQTVAVSAGAVTEIDLAVQVHWPPPDSDIQFRLRRDGDINQDTGTPLTHATPITLTTSPAADRPHTITRMDPSTTGHTYTMEVGPPPKSRLAYANGRWWFCTVQTGTPNIARLYSWDGSGAWEASTPATMTANGQHGRQSVAFATINGVAVVHVTHDSHTTRAYGRRGVLNSDGSITWGDEWSLDNAGGHMQDIVIDDAGYLWVGGRVDATGVRVHRSTHPDTGAAWTPGFESPQTIPDTEVLHNGGPMVLQSLSGGRVLALYHVGGSGSDPAVANTIRYAVVTTSTAGTPAAASTTFQAHREDWGSARYANRVWLIHAEGYRDGPLHLRMFDANTESWTTATDPEVSGIPGYADGVPLSLRPDGNQLYIAYTGNGGVSSHDRVIMLKTYTVGDPNPAAGVWSAEEMISPADRGNADHINLPRIARNGELLAALAFSDDDTYTGWPRTAEYHVAPIARMPGPVYAGGRDQPFLVEIARPGATGGNVSTVDWTTIRADVDGLLELPQITELGSIPNVDETGVADGHVLVRSGDDYVTQELVAPAWGAITGTLADQGDLNTALGGKASASHSHTTPSIVRSTFGAGGYMSSGSRSLTSTPVTLASGIEYLVVATLNMQMRGADPGACYYRLSVVIDGNTRQSNGGSSGFWCVQGVPDKTTWVHSRTLTGTGSAITVSASVAYHSGGGFYTDAGELEVRLFPAR